MLLPSNIPSPPHTHTHHLHKLFLPFQPCRPLLVRLATLICTEVLMGDVLLIWYFILCNLYFYSFTYHPIPSPLSWKHSTESSLDMLPRRVKHRQWRPWPFSPTPFHTWPSSRGRTTYAGKPGMKTGEGWGKEAIPQFSYTPAGVQRLLLPVRVVLTTRDWIS